MRVLVVKLTSMGDLIHALPALTDAVHAIPGISFDWVADKNFAEIPSWHPAVKKVIPSRHRYWRKHWCESLKNGEISQFLRGLRAERYDVVIDAQSSLKSALITRLSRGLRCGLDKHTAKEGWIAALAYQRNFAISQTLHAIPRLRSLFAQALNYPCPVSKPDYGIKNYPFPHKQLSLPKPYVVFVHNASWPTKLWPANYWRRLVELASDEGLHVLLPWGNAAEKTRAEMISAGYDTARVLPFCSLSEHARILQGAAGAICSDTGLCHLAAALSVPAVTLYGPTDPALIGAIGHNQRLLVAPFDCLKCRQQECHYNDEWHADAQCLLALTPEIVWEAFKLKTAA